MKERKFEIEKVLSSLKKINGKKVWHADQQNMPLIITYNKRLQSLLYFIDILSIQARVIALKDKKDITITNASQKN